MIKLGILMDPIENINFKKDSSLALLLEAKKRDYCLYYMNTKDLYLINDEARAHMYILNVNYNCNKWYEFISEHDLPLTDLDVILMRKDPPFNMEYIYSTYILEKAKEKGTLIINNPKSLRDCNEKIYASFFSKFIPETIVTSNKKQLEIFWEKHGDIILKPLNKMGGSSIFFVKKKDLNFNVIVETLTKNGTTYCMAQKYIPAIIDGDKRILIINGKPVPYCLARIPKDGEIRGNLAVGGFGEVRPLTKRDYKIASHIGRILEEKELIFVGLDIIGDYLIEINITSPTCIREIEDESSISISSMLMESIEKKLKNKYKDN